MRFRRILKARSRERDWRLYLTRVLTRGHTELMNTPFAPKPKDQRYQSFLEFWPFYLSQHTNGICRALHAFGTTLGIVTAIAAISTQDARLIPLAIFFGYGFSWIGHFVFEKNTPATFSYFRWSLIGDFKMLAYFYTGKLRAEFAKFAIPMR